MLELILPIATILMDIGLGAIALRLARSLEKTQTQQTIILTELTRRVEKLEGQ